MLSGIAFALALRGHGVSVITSRLRYDNPKTRLPARETLNSVEVHRVATSGFGRHWLVGRAVDYVTFYLSAAWALFRLVRRGDVVIVKTDPPMLSVVLWPIVAWRGARLVNWLQDIFPEVALALGIGRRRLGRLAFSMLKSARNLSLRCAAMNVVLGDRMADHVAGLGVLRKRIRIVPNWANGALIHQVSRESNSLKRSWGLDGDFVVGYSGNLGRAHDYATFLDAILRIERSPWANSETIGADTSLNRSVQRRIRWLFIGGGAQFEELKRAAEREGVTSVLVKPYQPEELLAQSLSAPDVHLVTLRPELEGLIVPSKIYGIAAAGRAAIFIGDANGEIARLLARSKFGTTVPQGDGAALATTIQALAQNPAIAAEQGRRARATFESHFDLSQAVAAWERVVQDVLVKP
ncbi:MAG: glycosyltransferase family 4 protein [Hyphomicrobiaceae bacterium]|nr:glycosyltransferase family 4 protein [Hyphomicrobiaceae bacterium]